MFGRNMKSIWLALPLAAGIAACGGVDDQRSALQDDELGRQLDLALRGDSVPAVFQDSAANMTPELEPDPDPRAVPQATPRRSIPRPVRPTPEAPPAPQPEPRRDPAPAPVQREPEPRVTTATVAMGTNMSLRLNQTLSTENNRVGDTFTATLQSAITDGSGRVIIPAGATVRGRLTQVNKSGRVGETGVLKLAFESVSFGGGSYPMDASVVKADPQRSNRTSTKETVAKAAGGAVAGAVLGRVIGKDTRSTIGGAVIGAAAGTAIAMGTADVDVVLPAGSTMVIRVDSPIEVRRVL